MLLAVLLGVGSTLSAQREDFLSRSELLLMGGGMNYIGDLNEESALTLPRPAAGAGIRYRFDNRWSLRVEVSYGQIGVDEDYNKLRNLSFRSDILEGAVLGEFNFAPFGPGATERLWTPYIFGGVGVFHFNPMARYTLGDGEEHWAELQPLCTEGQGSTLYPDRKMYQLYQFCLPFGVGVKVRLGKVFSLAAEYGFRKTWTDYLDDVSKTYVAAISSSPTRATAHWRRSWRTAAARWRRDMSTPWASSAATIRSTTGMPIYTSRWASVSTRCSGG